MMIIWKDKVAKNGNILGCFLLKPLFLDFHQNKLFQNMVCCRFFMFLNRILKWFDVDVSDFQIELWCR